MPFIHFLWLGPVELGIVLYFLSVQIGIIPALAGVGVLLLFIPLQGLFARRFGSLRKRAVRFRDDRVRAISDLLMGMQVVKLNAWERPFEKMISDVRVDELSMLRKASYLKGINEAFFFGSPVCRSAFDSYFARDI
jgi:ATP-binding cassette subfamily C (CFTR/MRP) protein 4